MLLQSHPGIYEHYLTKARLLFKLTFHVAICILFKVQKFEVEFLLEKQVGYEFISWKKISLHLEEVLGQLLYPEIEDSICHK